MTDRCPHEVHPDACADCRTDDSQPRDDAPPRPFRARFDGTCGGCGFDIRPGDRVHYADGHLVHTGSCS